MSSSEKQPYIGNSDFPVNPSSVTPDNTDETLVEFNGNAFTIPDKIDGFEFYNRIVDLDTAIYREAQELEEPSRFDSSFEERQKYLAEIARISGIREGIRMILEITLGNS